MKDSQRLGRLTASGCKYIKENNERFSTVECVFDGVF